jgi:hypothetical protein
MVLVTQMLGGMGMCCQVFDFICILAICQVGVRISGSRQKSWPEPVTADEGLRSLSEENAGVR